MSKQYTLASERADAPTGCAYVAPTFWNKWFRWDGSRASGCYQLGRAGQGRKPHRPADFFRWRMAPGRWMDIGQLRPRN